MAVYRDKTTGVTVTTDSVLSGDWVLDEDYQSETKVEGHDDDELALTVPVIKAKLDELGIEYKPKMNKAELLALLPD